MNATHDETGTTNLWKQHFHWKVLLGWEVLAWVLGTFLAVGGILLVFEQYSWANGCFIGTAVFVFAKICQVATLSTDKWWQRMIFTFVLFGVCGLAIVESIRGVNRWASRHGEQPVQQIPKSAPIPPASLPVTNPVTAAKPSPHDELKRYHKQATATLALHSYVVDGPHPDDFIFAGILWKPIYSDVRLDLSVEQSDIQDVDFVISLDESVAGVGQITQFPDVIAFPVEGNVTALTLFGKDEHGNEVSLPVAPTPGNVSIAPSYRVHCKEVLANTVLRLAIASVAISPRKPDGSAPDTLFAPRRDPTFLKIDGSYKSANVRHPLQYSMQLTERIE